MGSDLGVSTDALGDVGRGLVQAVGELPGRVVVQVEGCGSVGVAAAADEVGLWVSVQLMMWAQTAAELGQVATLSANQFEAADAALARAAG